MEPENDVPTFLTIIKNSFSLKRKCRMQSMFSKQIMENMICTIYYERKHMVDIKAAICYAYIYFQLILHCPLI